MISSFILIILILSAGIFINCTVFWIFLDKKIKLFDAIKISCVAIALNKLFLTGSGYAAMSYKLKKGDLPLYKSISSFIALELFSILPWLISGFYFGSKVALKVPVFFAVFLAIALIFVVYKKDKAIGFIKESLAHFKETKFNILVITPLVFANLALGVYYYFFLLGVFGFTLPLAEILKIATISFTIGYLSPAPAGLGFKESGLVFLLMQKNLSFKSSLSIAITDRAVVTVFYLVLGLLFAGDLISKEIRARFKLNKK